MVSPDPRIFPSKKKIKIRVGIFYDEPIDVVLQLAKKNGEPALAKISMTYIDHFLWNVILCKKIRKKYRPTLIFLTFTGNTFLFTP